MRFVRDIPQLHGAPVLVRTALNVPLAEGRVASEYRLRRALPTIAYLRERGARIVLISHIGDSGTETLAPVAAHLAHMLSGVAFSPDVIGEGARAAVRALVPGGILVLENLRRHKGERTNDRAFAHELSLLADYFVQDSFDTCHRLHASIVGVPDLLPSYAGLLLEEETRELAAAQSPKGPALAVIGGAKFSTKEAIISALVSSPYAWVVIGGALANDFLRAAGREVGKSLVSGADATLLRRLLGNRKIILPEDVLALTAEAVSAPDAPARARTVSVDGVRLDEAILDSGPKTSANLAELVGGARTILWNGPLGNYERGFLNGTNALARAIASSDAHSVVGGGDTVAAIEKLGLLSRFSFVSTGGGAMLEYLAHGTLPGIDALR